MQHWSKLIALIIFYSSTLTGTFRWDMGRSLPQPGFLRSLSDSQEERGAARATCQLPSGADAEKGEDRR